MLVSKLGNLLVDRRSTSTFQTIIIPSVSLLVLNNDFNCGREILCILANTYQHLSHKTDCQMPRLASEQKVLRFTTRVDGNCDLKYPTDYTARTKRYRHRNFNPPRNQHINADSIACRVSSHRSYKLGQTSFHRWIASKPSYPTKICPWKSVDY